MNTINGTITIAEPVDSTDPNSNKYQWITIEGPSGPIRGRIGSKQGYQANTPINVTVEIKESQQGQYNYFKRYNPAYVPGTPPPQKPSRAAPAAQESTNGQRDMRIVRGNALNAVMSATQIGSDEIGEFLLTGVQFILTGVWKLSPPSSRNDSQPLRHQTEPDAPEDDGSPITGHTDNW